MFVPTYMHMQSCSLLLLPWYPQNSDTLILLYSLFFSEHLQAFHVVDAGWWSDEVRNITLVTAHLLPPLGGTNGWRLYLYYND